MNCTEDLLVTTGSMSGLIVGGARRARNDVAPQRLDAWDGSTTSWRLDAVEEYRNNEFL